MKENVRMRLKLKIVEFYVTEKTYRQQNEFIFTQSKFHIDFDCPSFEKRIITIIKPNCLAFFVSEF